MSLVKGKKLFFFFKDNFDYCRSPVPVFFPFLCNVSEEFVLVFKLDTSTKVPHGLDIVLTESLYDVTEALVLSFHSKEFLYTRVLTVIVLKPEFFLK